MGRHDGGMEEGLDREQIRQRASSRPLDLYWSDAEILAATPNHK
jgi:hypothetical protein